MIEVKEAIEKASRFAEEVYAGNLDSMRVEEIDSTDDLCLITLSFELPMTMSALRASLLVPERQYKIFQVNKTDGRVQSMKIRQVG